MAAPGRQSIRLVGAFISDQKPAIRPPLKLFMMGLLTNLLNPRIAVMYLSLLQQFINPLKGDALTQSLSLKPSALCHIESYLVLTASLAAKHKNMPPVALSMTLTKLLFFNMTDAKCVDKMSVTDHIVPIVTWMLTRIKVHIKGE
jgi:threonine/homoserine/homoserine lactone efflux protein